MIQHALMKLMRPHRLLRTRNVLILRLKLRYYSKWILSENYMYRGKIMWMVQFLVAFNVRWLLEKGENYSLKLGKLFIWKIFSWKKNAARRIKTEGKVSYFRLDRLGIPLIEITTAPELYDPQEARDAAYRIGMLLRSSGKVKKVLGSIRQDVNISIADGSRIEVKGVQKLDWIPDLLKYETQRQLALLDIKKKLLELGLLKDELMTSPSDITDLLANTECKFVAAGIKKGEKVLGMKIASFKGIYGIEVQPNRRFGTEVAGKVKVLTGLKGLIHSDEDLFGKYNFSQEEIDAVRSKLDVGDDDLFVMIMGPEEILEDAFNIVIERTKFAFEGVPEETRQANEDGTHEFLRELHGGARLYPDTDSLQYILPESRIEGIQGQLGIYPWEMIDAYAEKFNIDKDTVENMIMAGNIKLFDKLVEVIPDNPMIAITTLNDTVTALHREEKNIDVLEDHHFIKIFNALKDSVIGKEARYCDSSGMDRRS